MPAWPALPGYDRNGRTRLYSELNSPADKLAPCSSPRCDDGARTRGRFRSPLTQCLGALAWQDLDELFALLGKSLKDALVLARED